MKGVLLPGRQLELVLVLKMCKFKLLLIISSQLDKKALQKEQQQQGACREEKEEGGCLLPPLVRTAVVTQYGDINLGN